MSEYISCADTAKLIRKALKVNFADTKFSVRSRTYAGGASIDVQWTDGPSRPAVEQVVKVFEGSIFDGSIDLRSYVNTMYNGAEVHFGADSVMCHRRMTRMFIETVLEAYYAKWPEHRGKITIGGSDENAGVNAWHLGYWDEQKVLELLHHTNAKDMHRPYAAEEEREQAEHEEWVRNEPQRRARAEKEAAEEAAREQERIRKEQEARQEQERARQQRQRQAQRIASFTRQTALMYLGLSSNATPAQIMTAFRAKVKQASDGQGGYTGDMDRLVKAKEAALQR